LHHQITRKVLLLQKVLFDKFKQFDDNKYAGGFQTILSRKIVLQTRISVMKKIYYFERKRSNQQKLSILPLCHLLSTFAIY